VVAGNLLDHDQPRRFRWESSLRRSHRKSTNLSLALDWRGQEGEFRELGFAHACVEASSANGSDFVSLDGTSLPPQALGILDGTVLEPGYGNADLNPTLEEKTSKIQN